MSELELWARNLSERTLAVEMQPDHLAQWSPEEQDALTAENNRRISGGDYEVTDEIHTLTVTAIVATSKWYRAHTPYERMTYNLYPEMVYISWARDYSFRP